MEIDWGTAIVGVVSLLIFIVPLALINYNRKKKETQMLQSLNTWASQQKCGITHHELCGDFALGIDQNKKVVFFIKQKKDETIQQLINLESIHSCQAAIKSQSHKHEGGNYTTTERIDLCFVSKEKNKSETNLELYNRQTNSQLSGELQFVENWAKQINALIRN